MRIALCMGILCLHWAHNGHSSNPFFDLLSRLEYDQEIRGLFIPKGYFHGLPEDLAVGLARISPENGKLYSLGWRPALHLDCVSYGGSSASLIHLVQNFARKNRTTLYLNRVRTQDRGDDFSITISRDGFVREGI